MKSNLIISIIIVIFAFLSGCCTEDEQYDNGYKSGYSKGLDDGYKKGFETGRPGTKNNLTGIALSVFKILLFFGAIKLVLVLIFCIYHLIVFHGTHQEILGKMLFGGLGTLVAGVLIMYTSISGVMDAVFLIPAPEEIVKQILVIIATAVVVYWLFKGLFWILDITNDPSREGWVIFFLTVILSILVSFLHGLYVNVPDLSIYYAGNIFIGTLVGGIYYFARTLLIKDRVSVIR